MHLGGVQSKLESEKTEPGIAKTLGHSLPNRPEVDHWQWLWFSQIDVQHHAT